MNIIHIIPGSGGSFYCGNCLRDSKYYLSLRDHGHDVLKIPMYLPIFSDEHDLNDIPVFYGAVSIYLKQLFPIFRKAPQWFDKLLNSKPMLKYAAGKAGSTRAKGLEEMTISMLLGENGKQREELDRMTDWLKDHYKPDVIHLSNALLLGLAHQLKEKLNVPVVCSLQDEDVWVDVMKPESSKYVWNLMSEKAKDVDLFVSVSDFYTSVIKQRMNIPDKKIQTVHLGVDPADYNFKNSALKSKNIGFISRLCHENGLDILIHAFLILKQKKANSDVKLIITGGSTGDDAGYLKNLKKEIKSSKLYGFIEFHEQFEGEGRKDFFDKVSVVSVPVRNGEAFGIYITEAMASGIPVVQPALGAFPEIINKSGGGIVYPENTPECLANHLDEIINDRNRLEILSNTARKSIEDKFNINILVEELIQIYQKAGKTELPF